MARKDNIYLSFINHDLIQSTYDIPKSQLPVSLKEGLISEHKILKTVALIVSTIEENPSTNGKSIYDIISKSLNRTL